MAVKNLQLLILSAIIVGIAFFGYVEIKKLNKKIDSMESKYKKLLLEEVNDATHKKKYLQNMLLQQKVSKSLPTNNQETTQPVDESNIQSILFNYANTHKSKQQTLESLQQQSTNDLSEEESEEDSLTSNIEEATDDIELLDNTTNKEQFQTSNDSTKQLFNNISNVENTFFGDLLNVSSKSDTLTLATQFEKENNFEDSDAAEDSDASDDEEDSYDSDDDEEVEVSDAEEAEVSDAEVSEAEVSDDEEVEVSEVEVSDDDEVEVSEAEVSDDDEDSDDEVSDGELLEFTPETVPEELLMTTHQEKKTDEDSVFEEFVETSDLETSELETSDLENSEELETTKLETNNYESIENEEYCKFDIDQTICKNALSNYLQSDASEYVTFIRKKTCKELRTLLKQCQISSSGKKEELINKLIVIRQKIN